MFQKLLNKFSRVMEKIEFKFFSYILKKYDVEFFYKDQLSILSKRDYKDNFEYIFKTKNSSDAIPMMVALSSKISGCNICFDIGANIGITTVWMARNCNKVYAFEPCKQNLERLKENLAVNHISNVEVISKAVSDNVGQEIFYIRESYGHHSLLQGHVSKVIEKVSIESVTLDSFCFDNKIDYIDFLKIDVEGAELKVLNGASQLLKNKRIGLIVFEHSPILHSVQNRDVSEVIQYLIKSGYKVFKINHEEINLEMISSLGQGDLYAIPI
jgi:FkbM family methyltransferase